MADLAALLKTLWLVCGSCGERRLCVVYPHHGGDYEERLCLSCLDSMREFFIAEAGE